MTKTQNFKSRVANGSKKYHCFYQDQPVSPLALCHFTGKWPSSPNTLIQGKSVDMVLSANINVKTSQQSDLWQLVFAGFPHLVLRFASLEPLCDLFRGVKHLQPRVCIYSQRQHVRQRPPPWAEERCSPPMLRATLLLCSRRHVKRIKEDACDPTEAAACLPGIREKYSQL